jgi:hypothetical protein
MKNRETGEKAPYASSEIGYFFYILQAYLTALDTTATVEQ